MKKQEIKKLEDTILGGPFKEAQELVNSGNAWLFEGSVGRACMDAIESGAIMLGEKGIRDYYGNYVPSRYEVKSGTKGSPEFVKERHQECIESLMS